jgi:recombinational DNA repair protein RecR
MIPEMLRTQTEDLTTLMSAYHKQIDIKPQNVREFISFYENINTIIEHLDELSARLSEVSVINIIIKNNKNAMGESTESIKNKEKRVTEAQGLLAILRSKIN